MTYKIIYHCGDEITLKTKIKNGRLRLSDTQIDIKGPDRVIIPYGQINGAELFRLHGLGRMLRITHAEGILFVSVVRFSLFNVFAMINFSKTGRLHSELSALVR